MVPTSVGVTPLSMPEDALNELDRGFGETEARGERKVLSVSALTKRVAQRLAEDWVLQDVAVRGELSNFVHHSSGHMYFSLKDAGSQLRCVMFRRENAALRFKPANGMDVVAHGYVGVYETRGEYQLYVRSLEPGGVGALYQAFETLKRRLEAEGLFAPERKRPLPRSPQRVAVATSRTGAALRDLINIARRRSPGTQLVLIPTIVQGADAPASLVSAIRLANRVGGFDALIVGRGGGSLEDLWGFNDETVARAAFASAIPLVSAVGHETDFTILDFVADVRAPTPSAAAELVFPDRQESHRRWQTLRDRLTRAAAAQVDRRRTALESLRLRTPFTHPYRLLDTRRQTADDLRARAALAATNTLQSQQQRAKSLEARLRALSPYSILERGYSVFRDPTTCAVISTVSQARPGAAGEVVVFDGTIQCQVTGTTPQPRPTATPSPASTKR